jgi:hypothetical protein
MRIIFLILLCSAKACFPQSIRENIAFRVGYSQSTQSPDWYRPDQVAAWRNNIHSVYFGADYTQRICHKYALTFGPQVTQKGYKMAYSFYDPAFSTIDSYMYSFTYLDFPVNFIYKPGNWGFILGAFGSYLLHSDYRSEHIEMYYTNLYVISYKRGNPNTVFYNRYDLGINIGISRKLTDYLDVEFNFLRGLTLPDKLPTGEIRYQESFLFGIKYYFLKNSRYLVGRTENK